MSEARTMAKTDVTDILRRVGMEPERIVELLEPLEDPLDFDRDGAYLYRHGISLDRLIDRLGGTL